MSLRGVLLTCYYCALFLTGTLAQLPGWTPHQVNVSICTWEQPRAALVRDTVYLDGGNIIWSQGLDLGMVEPAPIRENFHGQVFTYNFSERFSPDTNLTRILLGQTLFKAATGVEEEPNASDGGMLANDDGFYLYGGSLATSKTVPAQDTVRRYIVQPGPYDSSSSPLGFQHDSLGEDVSRYIAFGAAANAPSENKAWYFSGLVRPDHGPITIDATLDSDKLPSNISHTLITLDMRASEKEAWINTTLPTSVKGRSNAEMVWVPVGAQGILVVLGGVTYPYWVTGIESLDGAASKRESPEFMQTIDIYDVASRKWYNQSTHGGPGTRSRGCAVVAPASDASSFNIYYYGGTDGLDPSGEFYDDVWILSLPSFTWTQIHQGTSLHSRAGHKCFMPYPDQMMVFGGYAAGGGSSSPVCLQDGPLVVFNLTSGQWMDSYDPVRHGSYRVPDQVAATIGGDGSGSATIRAPLPSGWSSSGLEDVFGQQYDANKIKAFGPYAPAASSHVPSKPSNGDAKGKGSQDKSHIIIPAVVVPVVLLVGAGLFLAWRYRRTKKQSSKSEKRQSKDSGSDEAAVRIHSWIRAQGAAKSLTAASEANYAVSESVKPASSIPMSPQTLASSHHEMPNSQLVELENTAPIAELDQDCLSPLDIIQKHSRHGRPRPDATAESWRSVDDSMSLNSRVSGPANSSRIDSPPLSRGTTPFTGVTRSDAVTGIDAGLIGPDMTRRTRSPASVSPPTAEEAPGSDYLTAVQASSSLDRGAHGGHWI